MVGFASLLVGAFVFATIDKTVVVSEQIMVIPGVVTSDSWTSVENILSGDLNEDSLFQNFTNENSAYLSSDSLEALEQVSEPTQPEEANDGDPDSSSNDGTNAGSESPNAPGELIIENTTEEETQNDPLLPSAETGGGETESELNSEPEPEQAPIIESEPEPEPESQLEPEPEVSSEVSWGVFPLANKKYSLVQEVITTNVTTTDEVIVEENTIENIVEIASAIPEEEAVEDEEVTVGPEEVIDIPEEEISDININTSSTESEVGGGELLTEEQVLDVEEVISEDVVVTTIYDACAGDVECKLYSTTYTGFSLPEFEMGTYLASAQLRLSLAARTKAGSESSPQRFVVEYNYDNSDIWQTATLIDINDEVSNSINSGYFLVSIDNPLQQEQIANLQVRVSYQGNIKYLDKAYIEGLWLEVSAASFYEEVAGNESLDMLDYSRELEQPKFHELFNQGSDVTINQLPNFTMGYDPQEGFISRVFNSLFSENLYSVEKVELIDRNGAALDVPFDIVYQDETTWTIKMLKQPQKLVPGKYRLQVTINENDTQYVDSFEFYWGVLAVNTTKSMYFPNEQVILNLAALTDKGNTICDADMALKVIEPNNTIHEVPIEQSGFCGKNNVTDVPDYLASFTNTGEFGLYKIQLENRNKEGVVVHKIEDSFEVREYIPFDIERTAPTRIYPPAPYKVSLKIKANRDFVGDITERVPRGFALTNYGEALISSLPEYTELTWAGVEMKEGDELNLTYDFDAPDISPYMYLLGPLDMDGFTELRQWQIASDALNSVASLTGTQTLSGTNLNSTPSPMRWSTSTLDSYYFNHSTSSGPEKLVIRKPGDYSVAVTMPVERTNINGRRTRVGAEVRVNGVAVPQGLGRSAYIQIGNNQNESSNNFQVLLTNLNENDYIEVIAQGITTIDAADPVIISGEASLYVEYIPNTAITFAATTTRTTNSTNFNQTTAYPLEWTETRQDTGFVHSDSVNPQNITISNPGTYVVYVNLPLQTVNLNTSPKGRVLLDGVEVVTGNFMNGFARGSTTQNDINSSMHWAGVVIATTTNQVLTITTEAEANAGTTTVPTGFVGSIMVQQLPSTEVLYLRGTSTVSGATNWNTAATTQVQWNTQLVNDSAVFTHSTTSNNHQITIGQAGDYLLVFNDALTTTIGDNNARIAVAVDGTERTGSQTKSQYISNSNGHNQSSSALVYNLIGITAGQVVTITTIREGNTTNMTAQTPASLLLWKKRTLDLRPVVMASLGTPFDNVRFASTTPNFRFNASDPDGSSRLQYEFSFSTSSDFTDAIVRTSGIDSGFSNTASTTNTSPFIENDTINFQLQAGDALLDGQTYYWRVRAKDVTGSNEFGDWSTTQSLTIDMLTTNPYWYQTYDGQFENNQLVGTISSGVDNKVQVNSIPNSEVLMAYSEAGVFTPRYRFWNGVTWGSELSAQSVTSAVNWLSTVSGTTRNEYLMSTINSTGVAQAQVYSASTSAWSNLITLSTVAVATRNGAAVAYETNSGRALVVSCEGQEATYRIWDGTNWSATSSISLAKAQSCLWVKLASNPASNEIVAVFKHINTGVIDHEAQVWNGSAWGNSRTLGESASDAVEGIAVSYNADGTQALVITYNSATAMAYSAWSGTAWTTPVNQTIATGLYWPKLVAEPGTDTIALCYGGSNSTARANFWTGSAWTGETLLAATLSQADTGPVDCLYESSAGRSGNFLVAYSDATANRYKYYDGITWSAEQNIGVLRSPWVRITDADDGTIVGNFYKRTTTPRVLVGSEFNGTSWSAETLIENNPTQNANSPREPFALAAKRFVFSAGTVTTNPITFTSVANQTTWGDISFSTTENLGTDVKVRIKYGGGSTCTTYVPNGVLVGNDAGFDVTQIPINISGLSTTTYSQLCLEASLTTFGSQSAALEDWELTWVRKPKLIQNRYQWYTNGSFITPTDPWPAGASDVVENAPIDAERAVSIGDTLRLRMSLQGFNVALATSTEAFKLQYASGLSCTANMNWQDVGGIGSTTAAWRGFQNSIVGSDWYNASWTRRLKITIPQTLVNDNLTNFPIYVNLANLPTTFFSNVKSNGADIRITEDDGLTERPYELVTIDTSARTGELHFKGDLASTTDTEFYIYYKNPSASAYSVSATYGRNNVWNNGYEAVYHLDTNPASTIVDSTSNGRNLTAAGGSGMGSANSTSSKIGLGIDFDGINDRLTNASWAWTATPVTVTAWSNVATAEVKTSSLFGFTASGNERLATHAPWSDNTLYWDYGTCCASPGRVTTNYTAFRNKWTHVGLVSQGTGGTFMGIYLDGVLRSSLATADDPNVTLTGFSLGSDLTTGGNHIDGRVDEFRIASVARSAGWVEAEFNNQNNPVGFFTISAEELIGNGQALTSGILSQTDNFETYVEENPTRDNLKGINVGSDSEWDFVLENNSATANTTYCFRMVYDNGGVLNTYSNYPSLLTNAPPLPPVVTSPFQNEQTASTSPWFEFAAFDELNNDVTYEIQVDSSYNFSSPDINSESIVNDSLFTNLTNPSERGIFTNGQTIRFISPTALSDNTTYWWRVRAKDDNGSGGYGEWSTPSSFTVEDTTAITTWYQTTYDQFISNTNESTAPSVSGNDTRIDTSLTAGTTTSSIIDYDNVRVGNAWGSFSFSQNISSGNIKYYLQYQLIDGSFALIPDTQIAGNSAGLTTSPVSLIGLDTDIYNKLRIVAALSGNDSLPRLQDWKVEWGERINVPTLIQPFDNAKVSTTSPALSFVTTDPDADDIQYEIQLSSTYDFTASSTHTSGVDAGFTNTITPADLSSFNNDELISYQTQTSFTNGNTYWWRVRAKDPAGSDTWSAYSTPYSFTVDTSLTTVTWYQTTGDQFATNDNFDIETTAGGAQITSVVSGVMNVYGESTEISPRYRIWNGVEWSTPENAELVGAPTRWVETKAAPTRPEFAIGTLSTNLQINYQIYDGLTNTWGNVKLAEGASTMTNKRTFNLAYESDSGDLLAVACSGLEAVYTIWNGSSWTATSSISLSNAGNCEFVQMASNPTSDEIIAVFRHTNTGGSPDYEALIWDGSAWGDSSTFGDINENTSEGIAVAYETSGDQAIVAVSNNTATTLLYNTWNGTFWAGSTTVALGDHVEFATLKSDPSSDELALCYIDNDNNLGVIFWNGSAWGTFTEIEQLGNTKAGRPIDCEYETAAGREGYLMVTYSDQGTDFARYQYFNGSVFTVEDNLSGIGDSYWHQVVRGRDGKIHTATYDDGATPDRIDTTRLNDATWTTLDSHSANPSQNGVAPYNGSFSLAAQIYPNFTTGSIRSNAILFSDGNSPKWERIKWNDITPGASNILYRVYYQNTAGNYVLIPDSALAGNASGFTNSPISLAALDTDIYDNLKLDAEFICSGVNCPTLQDWTLEWSEGITISGNAYEYDQTTIVATGTIAVAVNGVLQVGKTANISNGGTTTQTMVFDTSGTSTFAVPSGVTNVTIKAWGAGGGAGGGGASDAGGAGGGGGFVQGNFNVTPAEDLSIFIGGGGVGGSVGVPPGGGGGGGYSGVFRSSTPLAIAGSGGGGGAGTGGVRYVGVGNACQVSGASCTPTIPAGTNVDDVYIAVLHSRATTTHTCTTNCTGWTEFSSQTGSVTEGGLSVWYYRQTGAAPANPTFAGPTLESYTGRIWAYRGVAKTGNPYDVLGTNTTIVSTTTYAGSNLTSAVSDAMVVHVGGSMNNNAWGPASGSCNVPSTADVNFYSANANGTDNSIFLCYKRDPINTPGLLGIPVNIQAGAVPGRYFTFALRPEANSIMAAGSGGEGGGLSGIAGDTASTSVGGGGGAQTVGGTAGGGTATNGGVYSGGNGSSGLGGGAGGAGGVNGGGTAGTGASTTLAAGGGAGGSGYYGGGGGASGVGAYTTAAGGGGGSSYIAPSSTATSTIAGSGVNPGNSGDVAYEAGAGVGGISATSTSGANGGVGRVVISWSSFAPSGSWTIQNVGVLSGDVVTVFIDGASSSARAVGITKYDGIGNISGLELSQRHVTIGSTDNPIITNAHLDLYQNSDDGDLFHSVTGGTSFSLCAVAGCADARLKVLASSTYQASGDSTVVNLENRGSIVLATSTLRVGGTWLDLGNFTPSLSTVIFTATTSSSTLTSATSSLAFHNVTFGEGSGAATWNINKPLVVSGALSINQGTLARGTSTINIARNLSIGASGFVSGLATTTFDGADSYTWGDAKSSDSSSNIGHVVIDGTAKTITLAGNVAAESITIGSDDTLNSSGSSYNINVYKNWTNNNSFVPQSGTVTFVGTSTGNIARGTSAFNNLTFSGVGGVWTFSTSTLTLNGSMTIATGTVTLPNGTTTIGASFSNTGGTFLHNNGEVRMTSTAGGRTITQRATAFLNQFYDLVFSGNGAWSFSEANATTTRNFRITAGTVTLASSTLTVGGDFLVTGSGAFAHNNGEVILRVADSDDVRTNGSSFNNLRTVGVSGSWYNNNWIFRKAINVNSSQVGTTSAITDFPVYVNLNNLGADFFSAVKTDGGDIRVTTADGLTEVPIEIVSISTGGQTGELHFKAPSLSTSTNSTFYVYYGNSSASGYASTTAFGARNVWTNGYEAVYHLGNNPASTTIDSTRNGRDLTQQGGMTSSNSVAGAIGNAVDFDGVNDYLRNTTFAWPNASNTVTITAWNNVTTAETKAANLFGFTESGGQRFATHGPWNDAILYWDFGTAGVPGRVSTSYAAYRNKWTHVGLVSPGAGGGNMSIYFDGSFITSSSASDPSATLTSFSLGSLGASQYHDGRIDEFRIASVVRNAGWIGTEENNQSSTTAFYTVSGAESRYMRTFTDTNATILGNFNLGIGGDATLPTGVLSVGGSLDNDAAFSSNNGTVRFNSTSGAETIAAGSSTFATLEFNSGTGDFTVTENATATVAINLTNVSQFTLNSSRTLTALGTFTNAANGSNTTWTGSTLRLLNGSTTNMNIKTHGGDVYGTLEAASSTLAKMWNSSADTYVTSGTTGAIYSQDHNALDGDLYIYGNYLRNTGTEFWSFATDFDGVALIASTSRAVDVRVASSSSVGLSGASLNLVGSAVASTTIDAISGAFTMNATSTTITAEHFRFAGAGVNGLGLRASTTLSTFRDGFFTVVPNQTGITISSTTVAQNPSAQLFRIGFATTSAGAASNVTLSGTTSAFVWFREGTGNLYGENFDAGDGNPGSVRFDDSSNSIVVSGIVYSNDGSTPLGAPTCNGSTLNVRIVVNSGSYSSSTSCAAGTGAYSFPAVNYVGDPTMIVYLDTNTATGTKGSVVTKTPTSNITNMHIYAGRVITRHQDIAPLTIANMVNFQNSDDSDIQFIATTTGSTTLQVLAPNSLFVFATTTFAPGGNVTLLGNASSSAVEGTLQLGAAATFTASSTETHTLAGRLVLATTSTLTAASSTFIFNATTTGKSITSPNTITFNQLQFNGVGGGWNITAPLIVLADMHVATGTVTGTSNITITNGSLYGNGVLSLGSGTATINRTNTLGGTSPWTFNSLVLGNGSVVGTTTPASSATTTILGQLTIANAHFLDAGNAKFDLAGTGSVFVRNGTFLTGTSLITYSGNNATILGTNYYDLALRTVVGSSTFTGTATGINVLNNLTIGGGASTTVTLLASDPALAVGNNLSILSNGTFVASDIATTTIAGNYQNTGTFVGSNGRLTFTGSGTHTIAAGNSNFSRVTIDGTGNFTMTQNATSTGAFVLSNHGNFTLNSGLTLALGSTFTNSLGGAATDFTGSTLYFYGTGDRSINASSTRDTYATISVASSTNVRMWNSSASTYGGPGGIYSQNHASTTGLLHIYGAFTSTSANDYWSYATDFDGTSLSGGSERIADVRFASGSSAIYSGGSLSVIGGAGATTTIANQGSGTYGMTIGTGATVNWNIVNIRNTNINGVVFAGAPVVTDFSRTNHLIEINNGTAITVGGTAINANEAKNFTNNIFASSSGVTGAVNVTATGTTVSSWRFTNHSGNITGEAYDSDPTGDPGYIVWDDSAALVTVAGNVYSDEGVTVSTVCDGSTSNIRLVVAGLTTYDTTCNAGTGAFSIPGVAFSPLDTLTLYINGNARKAVNVTVAPISSISNMHLYENRVIVRHENTDPITIAKMAVWDSSDDADIIFTAVDAGSDTLTLPSDTKLLVWTGKTFEPNGNVTLTGAGAGADYDGTLEAQTNAVFRAKTTEVHSVGGSVIFGTGAVFTSASSTLTLTTAGANRTFDINANNLHNLAMTGSGSYNLTDATLTLGGSYTQSAGAVTFPTGTTTIGAAFNVTAGTFTHNGSRILFNGSGAGNTVRFNGSQVPSLVFSGSGSWNMTDVNATTTGAVLITAGGVTLPSGSLSVNGSFEKRAGTLTHNTSDIIMRATSSVVLTASTSDLFAVRFVGAGPFSITDSSITLLDSLEIASGTVALASTTTSVAGSFTATGGTFTSASGTVLLNASASGKVVSPGNSSFYNLQIGAPAGGYTLNSATTTNNFTISNVSSLLVNPSSVITVGGVFTNSVGGAATTWSNTTLALNAQNNYSINTRSNTGDTYGTIVIGANANVRSWYSNAATTTVNNSSSLYSQDHGNTNGQLNIYGNLTIATTTEYWNYARDFDGTLLTGIERVVNVRFAPNATSTVTSGELQIIGALNQETTIQNQGTGTYSLAINGGTLNANYYEFSNLSASGLQLLGLSTVSELANGLYDLGVNTGSSITLSSTTLNSNPSKIFNNVGFTATTGFSGNNVNLVGETANAWRFTSSYGNISGEAFDVDGIDACGSIRFDNSSCLLTEQTSIRWRNDDGGEGAPNNEWYNQSFTYRKNIRVVNSDAQTYASTTVKITVPYDSDMQSSFADLRFTSDDGLTIVPHYLEKVTASTEAVVWVKVPNMPASDTTTLHMYYGSSTATTTSSGTNTFAMIDDFENGISSYSGDTSLFVSSASPVYGGSLALKSLSGRTTNGLYRTDLTTSQGQTIRYMQYINADGEDACTLFGFQSVGSNYALCLQRFGATDRMIIAENVEDISSSGITLASTTVAFSTGWYEVEIDWRTNNTISAYLYNLAGALVATTTATDSTITTGGIGYTFWINNGSWDSYTARVIGPRRPTIYLGVEQTYGGATWFAAQNAPGNTLPGDTLRLRVAIENSGLQITGQEFRLQYAARGAAPTCESVVSINYATVPNQASCGLSPVCMQTSSFVSDGEVTTDLLDIETGTFTAGKMVLSPSNQTSALSIDQNYYTELEYALTPTVNASDAYCFRVSNGGTALDYYNNVAELGLQFDPTITSVEVNSGIDISLTPGTTTPVSVTATVTDFNGYGDISNATATVYRSGVGPACTADNNNCYILTTENSKCSFTSCSGNSCQLSCQADIFFHADATVAGAYDGEEWIAYAEVEDTSSGYDFASASGTELFALRALEVDSNINYGALEADSNTGSYNPTTTIANIGNIPINVDIEGTNLSDGGGSLIPAEQQKLSTSTFAYSACSSCYQLSSSTAVTLGINLSKPSVSNPPVETDIFWGIAVPFGVNSAPHSGSNTFTAIDI